MVLGLLEAFLRRNMIQPTRIQYLIFTNRFLQIDPIPFPLDYAAV